MKKEVIINPKTMKRPLTFMGYCAGFCTNSNISNNEENLKRGIDCVLSEHGRAEEFPSIYLEIKGFSRRVLREYMRHVGGGLTILKSSTRYINYENFDYITPELISNNKQALDIYNKFMDNVKDTYKQLLELNIPVEDVANILPLGTTCVVIDKKNIRSLLDMSRVRMCSRAYWEFRELFNMIIEALKKYSPEWKWVVENVCFPKCVSHGYCNERNSCGRVPKKPRKKLSDISKEITEEYEKKAEMTNFINKTFGFNMPIDLDN